MLTRLSSYSASLTRNRTPSLATRVSTQCLSTDTGEQDGSTWKTFGDVHTYTPGKFQIQTFNKISPLGLNRFDKDTYEIRAGDHAGGHDKSAQGMQNPHAILLRSHKLKDEEVSSSVQAIARCGAGTNNIPVSRMTERGIPVFNTPGANANAVKELIICGMLLGSRRIAEGVNHMKDLGAKGLAKEKVEKDKAMFGGREIAGKTLAVIGLGHIGAATARDANSLGMSVKGYDPGLNVQAAIKLPRHMKLCDSIISAVSHADYVSLNIPYIKAPGGTHHIISQDVISHFKSDAVLLNFARGELVDSDAMKEFLDQGHGRYVTDFPDDVLWNHKNSIVIPHLGASTEEAEDSAASMAADTVKEYLEEGTIRNSVNFPTTSLSNRQPNTVRFTVVNKNLPGMLAHITETFSKAGLNISQQINQSQGPIAYNVIDVELESQHSNVALFKNLQEKLIILQGVLSTRVLYGGPNSSVSSGFARNMDGAFEYV